MIKKGATSIVDVYKGAQLIEKVYKGAQLIFDPYTTITGTLPLTFNSRAAVALKNYRIYGTTEGAGVATESGEPAGFKIPISLESGENLFTGVLEQGTSGAGNPQPADNRVRSNVISFNQGTFICRFNNDINYDIAYDFFSSTGGSLIEATAWLPNKTFTMPTTAHALRIKIRRKDNANFTPSEIEGFGILEQSNYDLFIGDSKLYEDEYLDYEEQKVYKRTEQLLPPYEMDEGASQKGYYITSRGVVSKSSTAYNYVTGYIGVLPSETYALKNFPGNSTAICYYDTNKVYISGETYSSRGSFTVTTPANCQYVRMSAQDRDVNTSVFVKGNEIPDSYIPYLQPTDPPVPLPAIEAYKEENTLSSTETLGEVTVKGRIREVQNG